MQTGVRNVKMHAEGVERNPDKMGPIRPRGISSRMPFLLFVAFVAALFIGHRYVTDSELYRTAETFVRQNGEIRTAFGEVHNCRLWFPFNIDFPDDAPRVHLTLQVEGAKADTEAYVTLTREGTKWRVVAASYKDVRGQIRPLMKTEKPAAAKGKVRQTAAPQSQPKAKGPHKSD